VLIVVGVALLAGGIVLDKRTPAPTPHPLQMAEATLPAQPQSPGAGREPTLPVDPVGAPAPPQPDPSQPVASAGARLPRSKATREAQPPPVERAPPPAPAPIASLEPVKPAPATETPPPPTPPPAQKQEVPAVDPEQVKKVAAKRQKYGEILWTTPQDQETARKYAVLMEALVATNDTDLACKAVSDWRRYAAANCQWVSSDVLNLVLPWLDAINTQCGKASLAKSELMRCTK
jgi:hypothetical protein